MHNEVQMECPDCGIAYCLPTRFQQERLQDHKSWYCPNGHSLWYPGKTTAEKKIEELERRWARWREIASDRTAERDEARQAMRVCPFECGFTVKRKQLVQSVREALREHLLLEHDARGITASLDQSEERLALNK
jgi:hypothetical protein